MKQTNEYLAPEKLTQANLAIRAEQESQGFQGDQQIQGKRQHKMTENRRQYRLPTLEIKRAKLVSRLLRKSSQIDDLTYSYQNSIIVKEELQSFTIYLRINLVFMWNSALWEMFNFCFLRDFLPVVTKFSFWHEDWTLGYYSTTFRNFPHIFEFPKILILKSFDSLWGNSYRPCFLLIIVHRFTRGETKIW